MKKFSSSFFLPLCFALSLIFIVAGCARKAPIPPVVPEEETKVEEAKPTEEARLETKEVPQPEEEVVPAEPPFEEETIGGTAEEQVEQQEASTEEATLGAGIKKGRDDFPEVRSAPTSKGEFEPTTILAAIHFNFDKYDIESEDRNILSKNASWLTKHPDTFIKIEGHCDSRGTLDYNLALGDRRANATKNYLISLGIEPSRISTISYGEEKPTCTKQNEGCWSQNRRAEFLIAK